MGVSKEQALENRQAIVAAAARLFRERGVDGVGLVELMKAAGFTPGGFYNHFKSKQALAQEVVHDALLQGGAQLDSLLSQDAALLQQLAFYLSPAHRDDIEHGCPFAGLATDVARLGPEVQTEYAQAMKMTFERFGALLEALPPLPPPAAPPTPFERGMAYYSQLVGAVVLARSVKDADPALSQALLSGVRGDILAALALKPSAT